MNRANDAVIVIAPVDYTTCASATSFECSRQRSALFARHPGLVISSWERGLSHRQTDIRRVRDGVRTPRPSVRAVLDLARKRLPHPRKTKIATRMWVESCELFIDSESFGSNPRSASVFSLHCRAKKQVYNGTALYRTGVSVLQCQSRDSSRHC